MVLIETRIFLTFLAYAKFLSTFKYKNNNFYDRSRKTFRNNNYFQCNCTCINNELSNEMYLFISLSTTKRVVKMSTKNEYKKSKEGKLNAYWQHFALNILTTVTEFNFYVSNERNAL